MSEKSRLIQPDFSLRPEIRRQRHVAECIKQGEINHEKSYCYDIYDAAEDYASVFSQVIPVRMAEPLYVGLFPFEKRETYEQAMQRIKDFNEYLIGNILKDRAGQAIGIDLAGPGRNFFSDYAGVFKRSLGVVLNDLYPRSIPENHQVIEGNILSSLTHREILSWLDGEKADFIMERVGGCGVKGITGSLSFLYHNLNWYYSILREGGVMFFQYRLSKENTTDFISWAKWLNKSFDKTVTIAAKANLARLNKYPGAPEKLPCLSEKILE